MFQYLVLLVSASINLTSFHENGIRNWEHEVLSDKTVYDIVEYEGRTALRAISDNSASGLVLKQKIDLSRTPYLNWSWLAARKLPLLDEQSKSGDDYVARVYVVIDGGLFVWRTKSLSYVWSSNQSQEQVWDNAFAGSNVKMISVRGKDAKIEHWYSEKRNVYQDLIKYFGDKGSEKANLKAYRFIDIVAIMTDTDNSRSHAESYYGDILFSAE